MALINLDNDTVIDTLKTHVSRRKTSVPRYMSARGLAARARCSAARNLSAWDRWKMDPGSETRSRPVTRNWPPYTASALGSLAFRYSSAAAEMYLPGHWDQVTYIRNIFPLL